MPFYESVLIARPDISAAQVDALVESLSTIVAENGGAVKGNEYWGLKNLAYRIKKNRKGHYALLNIDAPADAIHELERNMRINEDVLRYLTIRVEALDDNPSPMMQGRAAREDRAREDRAREDRAREERARESREGSDKPEAAADNDATPETESAPKTEDAGEVAAASEEAEEAKDDATGEVAAASDATGEVAAASDATSEVAAASEDAEKAKDDGDATAEDGDAQADGDDK